MRIWILTEHFKPAVGGIERYLEGITSHLSQRGHEVVVISPYSHRFFWPIIRPNWLPLFLYLFFASLTRKPDVIICGKALVEGRIARLLQILRRTPYIICTYGMEISTWQSTEKTAHQLSYVLRHASHTIVINKKTRQDIIEMGADEDRISYVYPGINTYELEQMNNTNTVMQRMNIRSPFIITVARLVPRKGIDNLIEAFAAVTQKENVSLVIVGDGPERSNLEALAHSLHAPVHFTGKLSDEDIHALYSRASLFALTPKELPGDYEGFGIVYLEAAFFGLPTVGTITGGVPEAVQNGITGILVPPEDIKSITTALEQLIHDPSLATQYGNTGRKRAIADFQWDKSIDTLERILETL